MFVKGTLKKAGLLMTLAVMPLLLGYFIISFLLFSFIAFMMQFFRDPERSVEVSEGMILASADGRMLNGKIDKIRVVNHDDHLMKYILDEGKKGILISTFMSPFDVHVNRVPVSGRIIKTKYFPGKFQIAWKDVQKENEKNLIVIDSKYGKVGVIQIAGFVARRIVQYVKVGDHVNIGDRLGMIRFGSRVDIILPYENCEVLVKIGEKSKAGETIIARMIENNI
ncbi:MAG: phosphatidylserine decarboxylase family protein [Methanobacteriaceae archaeon]